ncbi:MAG: hypothetical protein C0417_12315 [Chlorobiaceae bacterium]|nr:hypothetical protein [Chlorobiaceae bacterium]
MKITYIVGTFPKLSETFVLNQMTDLIERGHEIDLISLTRSGEEQVHDDVTKYNLLEHTHFLTRNSSSFGFEITEKLVTSLIFTDIIHAHFAVAPTDFALKLSKIFNIPYVFTAHAYDIFIDPNESMLREKILNASRVITISEYNREYLASLLGDDVTSHIDVIRCGIDLGKFHFVNRAHQTTKRILFTGRFVEKKGIPVLIDAFTSVAREHPDAELHLIGDGPLRKEIEAKIAASPATGRIRLFGGQPQTTVVRAMEEADIVVIPSATAPNGDKEGVPVVLMEAMAMGLPVVSTLHSGIPELVQDGKTGFLVPENDSDALAQRINQLLATPALRLQMGKEGRKIVTTSYDHRVEMQRLEHLFNGLMEGRTSVSVMQKKQRALIEQRVRDIAVALIGIRTDQLRNIEQSIARYDDRMKKMDEAVKLLGDLKQKDDQIRQREQLLVQEDQLIAQKDQQLIQKDEQLRQKADRLKQKDEQLCLKDEQLEQKDDQLRHKDEHLKQKDDQLRQKDEHLKQKDNQLLLKDEQLSQKDLQISRFGTESKEKEQQIHEYRERLKQTNSDLKNAVDTLSHSKALLDEQSGQLQNLNEYVDNLAAISKNNEAKILELQQTLSEKDQLIRQKDEHLHQRDNKIKLLDADIKRKYDELVILRKWLGDITSSFPYKIFKTFLAPIRDLLKKKSDVNNRQTPSALPPSGKRDEIVYLPDWSSANPYQKMLYAAIEKSGTTCRGMQGKDFTLGWLWKNRRRVQIIHLHWLFGVYAPGGTKLSYTCACIFLSKVMIARILHYRFYWTVHNFISHEATNKRLESLIREIISSISEIVIVHCQYARKLIMEKWKIGDEKIRVIPHGSYVGFYPNNCTSVESRKYLNIPNNCTVFLFFGMVRKYKGLNTLRESFLELYRQHPDVHLVIAGQPHNEQFRNEIESEMKKEGISLFLQFIPDSEVQYFLNASDIVVLPYVDILTSGTALLAFTFGKPIIAPLKGCLPELVSAHNGFLYEQGDLTKVMQKAYKTLQKHNLRDGALSTADDQRWEIVLQEHADIFSISK